MNILDHIKTGDDGLMTAESAAHKKLIQEQTAASKTIRGEARDMGADAFRRGILDAGLDMRSGFEYGNPAETAREQAQIEQFSGEGEALLYQAEMDRAELEGYRRESVIGNALELLEAADAESDEDYWQKRSLGWGMLHPNERPGAVAQGFAAEEEVPLLNMLSERADRLLRSHAHVDAVATAKRQDDAEKADAFGRILAERGIVPGSAQAHDFAGAMIERTAARGVDLEVLGARDFEAEIRGEEALAQEERVAHAEARFKASILGETSGDVMSGITVLGPDGQHVPIQPRGEIYVRPNVERAIARSIGQPSSSAAAIREGVGGVDAMTLEHRALRSHATELFAAAARASTER